MTDPSPLEHVPAGEAEAVADLVALQKRLMDPSRPQRGQHAKGHGLVRGTFAVRDDVPEALRVGLFAAPASFDCWVRFSNGFSADDRLPDVHGAAIKVLHPNGDHDFLLVDHEVFFAADVRRAVGVFARHVELLISGVSPAEHDRLLAADYPAEAPLLAEFVRPPDPSPLEAKYFSGTPYAFGAELAVKYQLRPRPENKAANRVLPDSPDLLRAGLREHLAAAPATFDFQIRIQGDPGTDPIEDPTVAWSGPVVTLAALTIPPQEFDTAEREALADALSFNLWHAPAEHRPLGGINRGRKPVYEMSWGARRPSPPRS